MGGARLGLLLLTAALAFGAGRLVLGSEANAVAERLPLPPLPSEGLRDLLLSDVEGSVERGTAAAGFVPAKRGETLGEDETLRVSGGSRAALRLGVGSKLELAAGSEITAVKATGGELALQLQEGRARVELAHPGRALRVTSSDGAFVLASGGPTTRFVVVAHPGRFSIVNEDGAAPVRLSAADTEHEVPASRASWSVRGAAPRPPIEPPLETELEVTSTAAAPEGEEPGMIVTGRVHPLALLKLNGAVVDVEADGSFQARTSAAAEGPAQLLASLPTGGESLLEVTLAGGAGEEAGDDAEAADDESAREALAAAAAKEANDDAAAKAAAKAAEEAARKAAEEKAAETAARAAAEAAKRADAEAALKAAEKPVKKAAAKPKRKRVQRPKKAPVAEKAAEKDAEKPAAKKKTGVVTWGAK